MGRALREEFYHFILFLFSTELRYEEIESMTVQGFLCLCVCLVCVCACTSACMPVCACLHGRKEDLRKPDEVAFSLLLEADCLQSW